MNIDSIHFEGHSCFKKEWAGFDIIKPINIIIGRNNSGKSHLLDLVEALCSKDKIDSQSWQYRYSGILDEESLRNVFREGKSGDGDLLGGDHWHEHGRHFVDIPITWDVATNGGISNEVFPYDFKLDSPYGERSTNERLGLIREVLQHVTHQFNGHSFRRLLADRDIKTEPQDVNLTLGRDGNGASNIVRRFILSANPQFPGEVIKQELLDALNSIFGNDGEFSEITVQVHDDGESEGTNGYWEIYLGENKKGLISLSKSGSGLKTILLVLLNLLVVPKIENRNKADFVFAFEELENNLHPALLRRLFQYIEEYAINEKTHIFLTTHSSTALDFFGISTNAQIIHVLHDGETARTTTVSAHFDRLGVVSELGAKPSDLLQANGIVWVEGPSDRIYLNRWIDLYSEGRFQEGRDYQCAFYGGALLARTQFKSPEEAETDLVNLLRVNSNIIVVCDGDRVSKDSEIKGRVKRINTEVEKIPNAHIWITDAKEIENYIPGSVLEKALGYSSLSDPEKYENFFPRKKACSKSYIESNLNRGNVDKVDLAMASIPHMTNDIMADRFDWEEQMKKIVARIKSWNT